MTDPIAALGQKVERLERSVNASNTNLAVFGERIAAAVERMADIEERSEKRHAEVNGTIGRCFDAIDATEVRLNALEKEQGLTVWARGITLAVLLAAGGLLLTYIAKNAGLLS